MASTRVEPGQYCWAVIFRSRMSGEVDGYAAAAQRMADLAATQPGYLGMETCRSQDGFGITISYWASRQAITNWRKHPEHRAVRAEGRRRWYADYSVTLARVERSAIPAQAESAHSEMYPIHHGKNDD